MNMLNTLKKEWYVILLLIAPFVASSILWDQLPDQVPTHFDISGEADDWGPKWVNAIMLPGIGVAVYVLLLVLPLIDPKKKISSIQKPVAAIRIVTSLFMVGVYIFVMSVSLGKDLNMSIYIQVAVGAMLMVVGNYMNSVKPNYFIGIRTPWTLEDPEVWRRTHRLGSKLWVMGGFILMILPFIPAASGSEYMMLAVIGLLAGVPLVYSYIVFRQKEKEGGE